MRTMKAKQQKTRNNIKAGALTTPKRDYVLVLVGGKHERHIGTPESLRARIRDAEKPAVSCVNFY